MNPFKEQYAGFDSEYLLSLRAQGDMIVDEAHRAIEEIFAERGESLPAKPAVSVVDNIQYEAKPMGKTARLFVGILAFLVLSIVGHMISHSMLGLIAAPFIAIHLFWSWANQPVPKTNPSQQGSPSSP